jgi:hypothetical protein
MTDTKMEHYKELIAAAELGEDTELDQYPDRADRLLVMRKSLAVAMEAKTLQELEAALDRGEPTAKLEEQLAYHEQNSRTIRKDWLRRIPPADRRRTIEQEELDAEQYRAEHPEWDHIFGGIPPDRLALAKAAQREETEQLIREIEIEEGLLRKP